MNDVVEVADGYVFTGAVKMAAGNAHTDAVILKTNFSGTLQWFRCFGTANSEHISSVAATGANEVVIGGVPEPIFCKKNQYG